MRPIKFRLWNPDGNNMLFDVENVYECLMQQHRHDKTQPTRWTFPSYDHVSEGLVWEQFTGLLDKNGTEIYEGDIVKMPNEINTETFGEYSLKEVKFNNGGFLLSYLISEKGQVIPRGYTASFLSDCGDPKLMLWSVDPYIIRDLEVIGNIHQNPELLKQLES